jgi:hypothetical protein
MTEQDPAFSCQVGSKCALCAPSRNSCGLFISIMVFQLLQPSAFVPLVANTQILRAPEYGDPLSTEYGDLIAFIN